VQGQKEQQTMHTNTKPQATSAAAGSENPRTGGSRTCSHSIPSDARCHCQAHPFDSPKAAVSWHFFRDFRRCVCSFRFQRIHNDFIDLSFKSCGIQLPACLHANLAPPMKLWSCAIACVSGQGALHVCLYTGMLIRTLIAYQRRFLAH